MAQLQQQLEIIPGYDIAMDKFNEYAGDHFNGLNPFEDENGKKRKLTRATHTDQEQQLWLRVQKLAWVHDKCFLGSCGVGLDCGIGLVPLAVFFLPGLGPILTYVIHARLITVAHNELVLPQKLVARLQGNILVDFLISLPPLIGSFFSWMNGCLTKNAGLIYAYMEKVGEKRSTGAVATYVGTRGEPIETTVPPARTKKAKHKQQPTVGQQETGFR